MRQRPPTVTPEDQERIAAALAIEPEIRAKPARLNVSEILAKAPPSPLKPVVTPSKRAVRSDSEARFADADTTP